VVISKKVWKICKKYVPIPPHKAASTAGQLNSRAILFHSPAMTQHRNIHNLLKDFADEIPGYLNNSAICDALDELSLKSGEENIPENLRLCYERLIEMKLIGPEELSLLDDWLSDLAEIQAS